MQELVLSFPDDLAQAIPVPPEQLAAHIGLMAALKMFELGEISSGRAAELAGMSRVEFLEACSRYRVAAFNYPDGEIEAELSRDIIAAEGRSS
jgi:predicted HTH domain antitoxin